MGHIKSRMPHNAKRLNSFFAGIGGFELAFQRSGFQPTLHCENNDFCQAVLKKHWPESTISGDITKIQEDEIPDAEIWSAGFPCQDLSLARTPHGGRSGLSGARSGLFFTFVRLLAAKRPRVVLLENVTGLLNSHKGADFYAVIAALTGLGYAISWRVLNARYFGTPQSRPRIFICAWMCDPVSAIDSLYENELPPVPTDERTAFVTAAHCATTGISVPQLSFCISATSARHTGLDWSRSYITYPSAVRRLTPTECERLQGFPSDWTVVNSDRQLHRGVESMRYHAIGNAVCVPVVEWISERIARRLNVKSPDPGGASLQKKSSLQDLVKERLKICTIIDQNSPETKCKTGGFAYRNFIATAVVPSCPNSPAIANFMDIVEKQRVDSRYFLSSNAAKGIIRRVDKQGRQLFAPLDAVLRKMAG